MQAVHVIKVVRVAGAEQHLLTLLAALRARQIDARMLLLVEPDNPMDEYVELLGARSIPVQRLVIPGHVAPGLPRQIAAALRAHRPDITHTHLLHADLYGIPAARLARVPVVLTSRHNDDRFRYRLPIRAINRALWPLTDAAVAISDAIARFTLDVEGAPPARMHRIYYGLDTTVPPLDGEARRRALRSELGLDAEAAAVGVVCRLVEQKGVAYAIEAFQRLAREYPNAVLLVAGEGPLRPVLEQQAAPLGERVRFLGWRRDIPAFLAGLDVLLVPSLWEGFGLVILEAMAQQVPVVGSAVSAVPEVIMDGESGLLVPPRDAAALAAALGALLGDPSLRRHLGLVGRDRLETHFSAARMADQTAVLYQKLLDQKTRRGGHDA